MKKIKTTLGRAYLFIATAILLLMMHDLTYAQTISCGGQANIPPNGTITVNGVTINSSSSGSIVTYPFNHTNCSGQFFFSGALFVGSGGAWSVTLTFNKFVNNVVIALAGTGANTISGNENFIFNTNGGPVSISSDLPANCLSTINGNEILSGVGAESSPTGGGGLFRITSPSNFTTLTINGAGGYQGSTMIFCGSSIVEACNAGTAGNNQTIVSGTAPAALNLTGSTGAIQWQMSTDNVTFTNVASGGNTASYSPGTLTATRYYRAVVTTSGCTATSNVVTISMALDSDGDGIPDIYDLDDDNDGILDSAECAGGAVYNYRGFGIRSISGQADLIGFTGATYAPSLIANDILSGADANHLATDAYRNRILFANSAAQGSLFAYQFSTNSVVNIGSGFLSGLGSSSGGAAMYNNDYYIYDDDGSGAFPGNTQGLWRVTFNASGAPATLTKVALPPVVGVDLGDVAISHTGMAYITSNGNLYRIDLSSLNLSTTAPSSAWTTINTNSPISGSQLFFAANGNLIGSSSGNLVRVNPDTGANLGTVSNITSGYAWGDLSEAPTVGFSCGTDTDGDGIPNNLDLDSDNDGCSDAIEGASTTITNSNLVNSSMPGGNSGATSGSYNQPVIQNLGNNVDTNIASASYGVPTIAGTGQAIGTSQNALINSCVCYEDPTLVAGQTFPVKHGITILGRAGANNGDWPTLRNSAYTVLESKTKGFVITRNSSPETTIATPVVGMMVFDTDENAGAGCMKIYTGAGVGEGWKCFTTAGCP